MPASGVQGFFHVSVFPARVISEGSKVPGRRLGGALTPSPLPFGPLLVWLHPLLCFIAH